MRDRTTEYQPDDYDLHAYVEGVLNPQKQADLERYLLLHPDEARRVADYRAQKASLSVLLHEMPVPAGRSEVAELGASFAQALRRQRRFRFALRGAAASVLLVTAISTGWLAREYVAPASVSLPSITQQAADGYRFFAENGGFANLQNSDEAQDPFRWLSKRAGGRATASPDLASVGFELLDGWVFPTALGEAVQLLYQDGSGQVVTLYVVYGEALPPSTFSHVTEGDLSLLFWRSGNVSYCLVGRLDQAQLVTIAELVTAELGPAETVRGPGAAETPQTAGSIPGAKSSISEQGQTLPAKAGPAPAPPVVHPEALKLPADVQPVQPPAGAPPAGDAPRGSEEPKAPPPRPEARLGQILNPGPA